MVKLKETFSGYYKKKTEQYRCFDVLFDDTIVGNGFIYTGEEYINIIGNLGYYIFEEYRNNGFAKETLEELITLLFEYDIKSIQVLTKMTNYISQRVLQRKGFILFGKNMIQDEEYCIYLLDNPNTERG